MHLWVSLKHIDFGAETRPRPRDLPRMEDWPYYFHMAETKKVATNIPIALLEEAAELTGLNQTQTLIAGLIKLQEKIDSQEIEKTEWYQKGTKREFPIPEFGPNGLIPPYNPEIFTPHQKRTITVG